MPRRPMRRRTFLQIAPGALLAAAQTQEPHRPRVPGTLNLRTRRRAAARVQRWDVAQTAIVICDMWDTHTCSLSAQRVAAMAPRMNQVITAARSLGVMIIH